MKVLQWVRIVVVISYALFLAYTFINWPRKKRSGPFYVTYYVSFYSFKPSEVLISYRDSTGLHTIYRRPGEWSLTVCLREDDPASLLVSPSYCPKEFTFEDLYEEEDPLGAYGEIVYEGKIVANKGGDFVIIGFVPD